MDIYGHFLWLTCFGQEGKKGSKGHLNPLLLRKEMFWATQVWQVNSQKNLNPFARYLKQQLKQ